MLNTIISASLTTENFLICTAVSLILGLVLACLCGFKNKHTQTFALALAILPAVVQVVIMMVNGNIGTGVAIAGAFGLVRFRSVPGTAREICMIFLAMAIGLATGMGYVALAILFFVIMAVFVMLLTAAHFGASTASVRELKITIPETLDYDGLFDDLFEIYTDSATLEKVKTSNMGTLYELSYQIILKQEPVSKEFMDALRCRNGNLNIVCGRVASKEAL